MDYQRLISQWADEQGFDSFANDHAAVLRNLAQWLEVNAVSYRLETPCPECGAERSDTHSRECSFNLGNKKETV